MVSSRAAPSRSAVFFECFQPTSGGGVAPYAPIPPIERTDPASTNEVPLRPRTEERAPRTGNSPIAICARVSKDEGGPEALAGLMLRDGSQRGQTYGNARASSALRPSSA